MANQLKLQATTRVPGGNSAIKKIKREGLVPAVIYGGKDAPQPLSINARELRNLLSHAVSEHVLVDLQIEGGAGAANRLALIQEVQHDPIRGDVLHVDFHAVREDEKIHAEIPIATIGEANGVRNFGGILELALHAIEIECFPRDLPEIITLDVSELNVGDAIHVKDIQLPEGVIAKGAPDLTVVRVAAPKVEVATPAEVAAAAAASQPEVLKEKKDDAGKAGDKK